MKNKSFTLIELLVVIVIIGILAGVIMISTSSSIDKANFAKAQVFSGTVKNELLLNLVSEWTFDEGSNQTINRVATDDDVKDVWGSNNGTVYGNPQIKGGDDCVFGRCLSFNKNEYIDCGDVLNEVKGTISLWYNPFSFYEYNTIFDNSINADDWEMWIYQDKTLAVRADNGNGFVRYRFMDLNKWTYIIYSWENNDNAYLYVDGNLIEKNAYIANSAEVFYLGGKLNTKGHGQIDDVRIYNSALLSAQIKQNYIAGLDSLLSKGSLSKEDYDQRINALAYNEYE